MFTTSTERILFKVQLALYGWKSSSLVRVLFTEFMLRGKVVCTGRAGINFYFFFRSTHYKTEMGLLFFIRKYYELNFRFV